MHATYNITYRPRLNEKNRGVYRSQGCDSFGQHYMDNWHWSDHWSFSEMSAIAYPESLGSMVSGWPPGASSSYMVTIMHRYRSFSLSRNKQINWKPSSVRSQENEML